ncbi:hypothetical protein J6590_032515 [Homalodisca vitripennis]|nr:hypothetical protein J6590_032515 [Homalodisca vitripennis]
MSNEVEVLLQSSLGTLVKITQYKATVMVLKEKINLILKLGSCVGELIPSRVLAPTSRDKAEFRESLAAKLDF